MKRKKQVQLKFDDITKVLPASSIGMINKVTNVKCKNQHKKVLFLVNISIYIYVQMAKQQYSNIASFQFKISNIRKSSPVLFILK